MGDKILKFGKYKGWATAAVLLVVGVVIQPLQCMQREAAAETAEAETKDAIRSIGSYEELYQMIKAYEEREEEKGISFDTGAVASGESQMAEEVIEESVNVDLAGSSSEDTSYSGTNVQEQGVDEADIVKTDGEYIYALGEDEIRVVDAANMKLTGSVRLSGMENAQAEDMYVDEEVLQVITCGFEYVSVQKNLSMTDGSQVRTLYEIPIQLTTVTTYDISDKSNPEQTGIYRQDGRYLTSRKNGKYLYLFTSYSPKTGDTYQQKQYYYVPEVGGEAVPCEEIYLLDGEDASYSGNNYLVAGSVKNEAASQAVDRMAVVNGGETFYVSQKNIYAAAACWEENQGWTDLVRLGYRDGTFIPGDYGRVSGYLNNNFSMDEYEDHLRLVTTVDQRTDGEWGNIVRSNNLYVLNESLEITGKIEGLAENEDIQSARFMGDTGYFVTYRNMDPLFSVDLSDPEQPEILGELKITGFSEYLHFYGEDRLLGIGWETDPDTGEQLGLKCSMFDISNPADVKETDKLVLGNVGYCRAMDHYKEILVDEEKNIFGFAYVLYEEETWKQHYYYGVFSHEKEKGFKALEYLPISEEMAGAFEDYESLRGLYIEDTFFLVGANGLESYNMDENFEKTGELYW